MGLYDSASGGSDYQDNVSDLAYGLDNHAATADEPSLFKSASNVITKGIPLTGLSIVNSFANTAIDIGNFFGLDNQRLSIEQEVGDGDLNDWYNKHQFGVEAAGFAIGSLAPGLAAVKALKLLQAGNATNALVRASNIFAGVKQATIDDALTQINTEGSLFNSLSTAKYKAIAAGFGDQALQALVYQTAAAATMKASPLIDADGLRDTVDNLFFGTLVGGGIGGVLEGIGTRAIFNKALLNADLSTKSSELATYFGKGGYIAGDRVAALVDSLDKIPEDNTLNLLGRTKANATRDAAILNAKKILVGGNGVNGIISDGDNELADRFMDTLLQMKTAGNLDKEGMFQYLSRLTKATRINGSTAVNDGSTFYVNNIAKAERQGGEVGWNDLVTNVPRYNFDVDNPGTPATIGVSRAYKLKDGATNVSIARASDTLTNPADGSVVPLYGSAKEAFEAGHDVFVGKDLSISVNENATNIERVARPGESRVLGLKEEKFYRATGSLPEGSKPLLGAPLVLDTVDGAVKESTSPVVGDFGAIKVLDKGLQYGDNFSSQSISVPSTVSTSALDANARYVWAAERGIRAGDTIQAKDIPLLEQFYREGTADPKVTWPQFMAKMDKKGVSFSEDMSVPTSSQDLLDHIKGQKDDLLQELLSGNPDISSEEAALHANVKEDYIGSAMAGREPSDYMVPIEQSSQLRHIKLWYDVGNTNIQDGQILRGLIDSQYRIDLIKDATQTAATKFFSNIGADAQQFLITKNASDADIRGVGAKFLKFSDGGYDSLGQETERVGRVLSALYQKRVAQLSSDLADVANGIRNDPTASAELGMFRTVRLRTNKSYEFLPPELAAAKGLANADGSSDIAVVSDILKKDKQGNITGWDDKSVPDGFISGHNVDIATDNGQQGNYTFYRLSPKVAAWERANQQLNDVRIQARNNFYIAAGLNRELPVGTLYTPPINTSNYKHFAYVKMRAGMGGAESDASVITAESASDLQQKIAALDATGKYSIYTKDMLKDNHLIAGDYEYSRNFAQTQVNSALQKDGALNNIFPTTRAENLIKDYVDWHSRQEMMLLRDHVELGNGQLFAELKAMGQRFVAPETSQAGFVPSSLGRSTDNPYDSYIKTALAISSKDTYRVWSQANEVTEAFFDSAFRMAKAAFVGAAKGLIPFDQASTMAEKFGLGNVYGTGTQALQAYEGVINKLPPQRYLSKFVSAANTILGATVIKLDTFQQIIHILSTPILTLAEANSAKQWLTTTLPDGSGQQVPATGKIFFKALSNYFDKDTRETWLPQYKDLNLIHDPDTVNQHFQLMEALSLPWGNFSESGLTAKISTATKLAQKLTGTAFSEQFTSWMAAETGRLIFDAAGYTGKQLTDNIGTFASRVKGAIVASQRPVAFQGPLGQAIGLFQTYQFNMMNQLLRYVENGEGKTLAILAGLQTSLFGMSSLPGFQAINQHIIGNAATNPYHKDLYGATTNLLDKSLGDWLLYGTVSNWPKMAGAQGGIGLYSRGDMNPRNISLLPINPLDYPAIAGGIRLYGALADTATKIANGGSIPSSLLQGLEHNGLSRPLGGIAALAQGYTTTSKGSLISATRPALGDNTAGYSELFSAANFGRLGGARPLDEAVALDAEYRNTLYKAKDNARLEKLGEAVKSTLVGNQQPTPDQVGDFASKYAAAGGNIREFGRKMVSWSNDANTSVANKVFRSLQDPRSQNMMTVMGGIPLPDFMSQRALMGGGGS